MENFYFDGKDILEFENRNLILIIYDIVDNKRRNKFFKYLSGYATPVQKSCFETHLKESEFESLQEKISNYIDKSEDNVRIYKLSAYGEVYNYGMDNDNTIEEIIII